ncbi:MAG: hypothetical protein OEU09_11665 [Rhodospirillales bacterium]|nr:hypothetical protein [Rhodospirillales bacterium]MDH3911945.1 hypothetical protein [Rhodospirillales bacterium]MDH3966263.1 hypothetical protein [Rhodospirillales bacterium]
MTDHKKYISSVFAVFAIVAAGSATVSLVVDPYGVHDLLRIEGFNALKPEAQSNLRLAKAYNIRALAPEVIVLGNSRVDTGFDVEWASTVAGSKVYNAGLPGSSIYELYRYLQHAQSASPLRRVVLALDVLSFNTNRGRVTPNFLEGRLNVRVDGSPTPIWDSEFIRDLNHIYVSLPSFMKAVATIREQDSPTTSTRTPYGFNPMIEGHYFLSRMGYHEAFRRKNRNYIRNLKRHGLNFNPTKTWPDGSFGYLRRIVQFCRVNGIQLDLFIHPYHAHVLEIMRGTGLWKTFEGWKRELVAVMAADSARNPDGPVYPLWDFSTYNVVTTEAVPRPDQTAAKMEWYWESSHYKAEVGRAVAQQMYDLAGLPPELKDLGNRLTPRNIEEHLASVNEAGAAYRQFRQDEMNELKEMLGR